MMLDKTILENLQKLNKKSHYVDNWTIVFNLDHYNEIPELLTKLKAKEFSINSLMSICCVDYPAREKRFELVYSLLSLSKNYRILIKTSIEEMKIVPGISHIFSAAGWYEREIWDLYGVIFSGNSDMRRILTDYGFVGHPLRKDFPLTGHFEMHYDDKSSEVVYDKVRLSQDFRNFDFSSPWKGYENILAGDEKASENNK